MCAIRKGKQIKAVTGIHRFIFSYDESKLFLLVNSNISCVCSMLYLVLILLQLKHLTHAVHIGLGLYEEFSFKEIVLHKNIFCCCLKEHNKQFLSNIHWRLPFWWDRWVGMFANIMWKLLLQYYFGNVRPTDIRSEMCYIHNQFSDELKTSLDFQIIDAFKWKFTLCSCFIKW